MGVPDPGRDRPRDRLPAAAVLPVGRHRVRLPRPCPRLPHRRPARAPASGTPTSGGRTGTSGTGTSTCVTASSPRPCTPRSRSGGSAGPGGTCSRSTSSAMQYGLAATLIQAVDDFLEGPDVLHDGSAAAAAEIRRIRAAYPETQSPKDRVPGGRLPGHRGGPGRERARARRADLAQAGRLPPAGPPGAPTGMVAAGDAHWWHVSRSSGRRDRHVREGRRCAPATGPARGATSAGEVAGPAGHGRPEDRRAPAAMGRLISRENPGPLLRYYPRFGAIAAEGSTAAVGSELGRGPRARPVSRARARRRGPGSCGSS